MDMNGMNMDSSGDSGMMSMSLHFTPGDTLFFKNWIPTKPGPIFGACVALFLLAILDRWLAALRRFMELWWSERARRLITRRFIDLDGDSPSLEEKGGNISQVSVSGTPSQRGQTADIRLSLDKIPPFIASHDLARGIFVVFQSAITYALMLVVMTFNAGFIISVLLGLGTGEVLFGRLAFSSFTH